MTDPIKPLSDDVLLPGLRPSGAVHGRPQDGNLTNVDGQPIANTGDSSFAATNDPVRTDLERNRVLLQKTRDLNQMGVSTNAQVGDVVRGDNFVPVAREDRLVIDKVSGLPVAVRASDVEVDVNALQDMMQAAHDSLGDAKISEIPLTHPYWGLMESARQFKASKGL